MNRIVFMAALILSLSACDNTKVQLRAPESKNSIGDAANVKTKADSGAINSIKKDSVISD